MLRARQKHNWAKVNLELGCARDSLTLVKDIADFCVHTRGHE
jgi:hypothetical protein